MKFVDARSRRSRDLAGVIRAFAALLVQRVGGDLRVVELIGGC